MIVGVFQKQPYDNVDFTIDMNDWLDEYGGDTIATVTSTVDDPGLTLGTISHANGVIRQWVDDGVDLATYIVTIHMETTGGRELEIEVKVKVREH